MNCSFLCGGSYYAAHRVPLLLVSQSYNCCISEGYAQRLLEGYNDQLTPPNQGCTSGLLQDPAWLHWGGSRPWTQRTAVTKHRHREELCETNSPFPCMYHFMEALERECFWSLTYVETLWTGVAQQCLDSVYSFLFPSMPVEFPFWKMTAQASLTPWWKNVSSEGKLSVSFVLIHQYHPVAQTFFLSIIVGSQQPPLPPWTLFSVFPL